MEPRNPHHPGRFSPKILAVIFLAHFSGDIYQSFVAPILPLIKESIGLSLTQVGFVISTTTLAGQLSQPLVGVLADRFGPRTFLLTGLVMGSVLIPLMSITPWYSLILVLGALGALGSSMYHPTAAALVGQFSGARGGLSMSIFGLGGTLGYGFGPLLVTLYISAYGLGHLPYATLPGLVIILSMFFMLPAVERQPKPKTNIIDSIKTGLGDAWRPVMLLWLIGSLRSFADISIRTYYPIMYLDGGESLVSMGVMISLYVLGGSVSSVVCGELVDRKGFKPVFYASFALSTPCLIMFLFSQGWWVYPAGFIGGFILMATMFPSVALANRIAPNNRSLASSFTLGFAAGTGGVISPLVGKLAEAVGIQQALVFTSLIPLACLFFIHMLPHGGPSPKSKAQEISVG